MLFLLLEGDVKTVVSMTRTDGAALTRESNLNNKRMRTIAQAN